MVHLLDARGDSLPTGQLGAHTTTVFRVSGDHAGEFYASCLDDRRAVVTGLYSNKEVAWRLAWSEQFYWLVSFGECGKQCLIRRRGRQGGGVPEYCVEVEDQFSLDC